MTIDSDADVVFQQFIKNTWLSSLMSSASVERLIAAVARAFYNDSVVAVLDALVREKYIRNEEIGPRLKLSGKDVRKILNHLEEELLVKYEDLTMDDGRTRYSELEAIRLISKDNKFICSNCCPGEDFKRTMSQPSFTLIEVDNRNKLKEVQTMQRKMKEQLYSSDLHDGIYNLLSELKDVPLIRNRPSENIKRGIGASKITDMETITQIEENSKVERGRAKKEIKGTMQSFLGRNVHGGDFKVEVMSEAHIAAQMERLEAQGEPLAKKAKSVPDFLQGSRVAGGRFDNSSSSSSNSNNVDIMTSMSAQEMSSMTVVNKNGEIEGSSSTSISFGFEQSNTASATATAPKVQEMEDDVAWEDGDVDGDVEEKETQGESLTSSTSTSTGVVVEKGNQQCDSAENNNGGGGEEDVAWED
eukprot:gene10743-22442_t